MKRHFRSWLVGLVCVVFVAGACAQNAPETAEQEQSAVHDNGWWVNGWWVNGWRLNGWDLNGWWVNGWRVNGWRLNHWRLNGWTLNGWSEDDLITTGIPLANWPEFDSLRINGHVLPVEGDSGRVLFGFLSVLGTMSLTDAAGYISTENHILNALMESPAIDNMFGKVVGCALPQGEKITVTRRVCSPTPDPVEEAQSGGGLTDGKTADGSTKTNGLVADSGTKTTDSPLRSTDGKTGTVETKEEANTDKPGEVVKETCWMETTTYDGAIGTAPWWADDTLRSADVSNPFPGPNQGWDYTSEESLSYGLAPPSAGVSNCILALYDAQAQIPVSLRRSGNAQLNNYTEDELVDFVDAEMSTYRSNLFGDPAVPLQVAGNVCSNVQLRTEGEDHELLGYGRGFALPDNSYQVQFSDLLVVPPCNGVFHSRADHRLGWSSIEFDDFTVNAFLDKSRLADQVTRPCPQILLGENPNELVGCLAQNGQIDAGPITVGP